eukprot:GHVN01097825.1.p1 GENE.GHVN01097825.1~~GHVN01097825.1.p1  ORF type:complete len:470 (+),score=-9.82 GHVN01097825.1:49-1458(+)
MMSLENLNTNELLQNLSISEPVSLHNTRTDEIRVVSETSSIDQKIEEDLKHQHQRAVLFTDGFARIAKQRVAADILQKPEDDGWWYAKKNQIIVIDKQVVKTGLSTQNSSESKNNSFYTQVCSIMEKEYDFELAILGREIIELIDSTTAISSCFVCQTQAKCMQVKEFDKTYNLCCDHLDYGLENNWEVFKKASCKLDWFVTTFAEQIQEKLIQTFLEQSVAEHSNGIQKFNINALRDWKQKETGSKRLQRCYKDSLFVQEVLSNGIVEVTVNPLEQLFQSTAANARIYLVNEKMLLELGILDVLNTKLTTETRKVPLNQETLFVFVANRDIAEWCLGNIDFGMNSVAQMLMKAAAHDEPKEFPEVWICKRSIISKKVDMISYGCVVVDSELMDDVCLFSRVFVHNCTIHSGTVISENCMIGNSSQKTVIGKNVFIGTGCVIPGGRVIEDNQVILSTDPVLEPVDISLL